MTKTKAPVVIEIEEDAPLLHPHDAPEVVDTSLTPPPTPQITQKGIGWGGWALSLLLSIIGFFVSLALWDFAISMFARNQILGWAFTIILVLLALSVLAIILRETFALFRLSRLDRLQSAVIKAASDQDSHTAKKLSSSLLSLYKKRPEMASLTSQARTRISDQVDADSVFAVVETDVMRVLDAQAVREIEAAARQVATVTALVPLAFADVATAMVSNIRMIRRIAQIYGGRGGVIGSWRLLRSVMGHLVATGAMAVGDDWLGSILGGGLFSKLSRRFGEGMINGALTARVGRAAMEVCRPMPFVTQTRPSVTTIVRRALTGVFDKSVD